MNEIRTKLYELLSEKTGLELKEISDGLHFEEDLNIGEVELLDIITEVEEMFGIEIDPDLTHETVGDLVNTINDELN